MATFETVMRTPDLGPGSMRTVRAHGHDIAVANIGQTYYAVDAICPVDGTNLGQDGTLENELLVCPGDDARFDMRTGERVDGGRTNSGLRSYEIRIEGNDIRVGGATGETA